MRWSEAASHGQTPIFQAEGPGAHGQQVSSPRLSPSGCGIKRRGQGKESVRSLVLALSWALHRAHLVTRQETMDKRVEIGIFCFKGEITENCYHLSRGTGLGVQSPGTCDIEQVS